MSSTGRALVASRVCLTDDLCAAVVIDANGGSALWLLQADTQPAGCAGPCCAPHEQPFGLPQMFLRRLHGLVLCEAPTKTTGRPCRQPVDRPGDRCRDHGRRA